VNDIDSGAMILELLADHESIIRNLRTDLVECLEKYGDAGTNNFLTDLLEKHEKMAWMLRSFISNR
jgi:starvation-inducible DNA-binding protein